MPLECVTSFSTPQNALLFYYASLITVAVLSVSNLVLHIKLRKEAGEAGEPSVHRITVKYRLLSTRLREILGIARSWRVLQEISGVCCTRNMEFQLLEFSLKRSRRFIRRRSDRSVRSCIVE